MSIFLSFLLAISLSIDAFGIGISYKLRGIKIPIKAKLIICLISVVFTGCSIFLGGLICNVLSSFVSKLIGSAMLAVLGFAIIIETVIKNKIKKFNKRDFQKTISFILRPFKITVKIIKDPEFCDFDNSHDINSIEAIYLGSALSIDSFGAGISSAIMGINSLLIPILVGICQFIFLCIGIILGKYLSSIKKVKPQIFVIISGLILIFLSVIRWIFS